MDAIYQDQKLRRESILKKRKPHKGGSSTVEGAFFKESATRVKPRKNESLFDAK